MPSARRCTALRARAALLIAAECYRATPRNTVMGGGVAAQTRHTLPRRGYGAPTPPSCRSPRLPWPGAGSLVGSGDRCGVGSRRPRVTGRGPRIGL